MTGTREESSGAGTTYWASYPVDRPHPSFPRGKKTNILLWLYMDRYIIRAALTNSSGSSRVIGGWDNLLGLGSISTTSSDRQSRKIDVQNERTSIAELDMAPPTSIVFPTPKIQKSLPYSLKRPRR